MGKNKMSRLLPSPKIIWGLGLFLIPALLLGAGVRQAGSEERKIGAPKPGPVLEVKIQEEIEKPRVEVQSLTLAPFFLIEEEASQVRVRRVDLALEFSQPEMMKQVDPQATRLRELVYDFLVAKEHNYPGLEKKEQQQVLAGIVNRYLGQEAVTAVKVDQSILLLR